MAIVSGLTLNFSGIKSLAIGAGYPKLPFKNHNHDALTFSKFQRGTGSVLEKYPNVRIPYLHLRCPGRTHVSSAGRNYQLSYNDDSREQPSQLKYIEWPSFQSTLKTASLTLGLVALLIVALSSVDSALSYLLGLILRRKA